ncbi:ubiquitin carboxyl-terminal hydrolase 33 [Nilaparvata lugens]|uniref:ubiquitin carboxyl-terminal hydrolase 33 n=1 Tax=Nilaparvata lugens TaxID=108931 RepID=UPI00193E55F8|nr:ubiquitin carboxyl-terminal hydrolase 33 [Nilaparvata lugens]
MRKNKRKHCCIIGCENENYKKDSSHIVFYAFPKDIVRRREWVRFAAPEMPGGEQWEPSKNSWICSAHFVGGKKNENPDHIDYVPRLRPTPKERKRRAGSDPLQFNPKIAKFQDAVNMDKDTEQQVEKIEPRGEGDAKRPETHEEQSLKGLKNIGNTCYMNAALQALSNTPPFAKYLLDCGEQLILCLENENHPMKLTRAVCQLLKYLRDTDENAYFRPSRLLRPVRQENPTFQVGNQQDTAEFLTILLNLLHQELKTSVPQDTDKSIISDLFDGEIYSCVQCLTCNKAHDKASKDRTWMSEQHDTSRVISVQIPSLEDLKVISEIATKYSTLDNCKEMFRFTKGWFDWMSSLIPFRRRCVSLHNCLEAFFCVGELKDENMYRCRKCHTARDGITFSKIKQLPEVLCINLKRFLPESTKITEQVSFPITELDMTPYVHSECLSEIKTYDLMATICHKGNSLNSGHYICYGLHEEKKIWFEYDDLRVTKVTEDKVASCEAYLLFYRKRDSPSTLKRREGAFPLYALSKLWLSKLKHFVEPGAVENDDLVCSHAPCVYKDHKQMSVQVSASTWESILRKFGGGPICPLDSLVECEMCGSKMKDHQSESSDYESSHDNYGSTESIVSAEGDI